MKFWDKFGNLTVISNPTMDGHDITCMCVCGHITRMKEHALKSNTDKSCSHCKENMKDPRFYGIDDLYRRYLKSAHKKGLVFSLDRDLFFEETQKECAMCGTAPTRECVGRKKSTILYNGLDRKDNHRGYIEDNIQTLCWPCNKMKGDQEESEFLALVETIYNNRIKNENKRLSEMFYEIGRYLEDYPK